MDRVGFGVIGAGLFGENHARVYSRLPGVELAAVCDQNDARAKEIAEKYGARTYAADYRDLLTNPDIRAVSIATPDFAHAEIALAAAEAGKHILVEKPLATSIAESQAIVAAAKQAGVKLMVDFHNRVNPPFVAARDNVQSGALGEPAYAYVRLSNTTFVPQEMLSWADRSSALWFLGSHAIDIMRFILHDEVVRVHAVSRSGILQGVGIDTPDFHVAIAEFAGGPVVTFEHAWILPRSQPMVYDFKLELLGSEGAVYVDSSHHGALELHTGGRLSYGDVLGATPTSPLRTGGFVAEAIAQFADAVLYDRSVLATGEDGVAATRVVDAIVRSAETGQPVDL
ncbi:MAG TPA: Gfo/Idh/MocA family oxidoreductase [Thermomicrobiales bacterium]|nr:Gfo/Idh/MocA family oxidoreductase [Thermomicrobiales bacterium]